MNKNIFTTITFTMISMVIILSIGFASAFASPANVDLGTAGNYIILAKTAVTTTGVTAITGDIGISPALSSDTSGFGLILDGSGTYSTSSLVTGKMYAADYSTPTPIILTSAVADMQTAYTNALGRAADQTNPGSAGEIGGLTIFPGVYTFNGGSTNVHISTDLTLSGGANDRWIFQIPGTFDIASGKRVILTGGAQAKNVFWVVAGATTLLPTSNLQGNILDSTNIAIQNDATLNGRALAQTAVTLIGNTIVLSTVNPQFSNYTILLNSSQNVSITASRGNISVDGIVSTLPVNKVLTNTTHSILFTPSVGFAFLRWNATGNIAIANNFSNSTTAIINGNGAINAIYYNTSLASIVSRIVLSQTVVTLVNGDTFQLSGTSLDQFGDPIASIISYSTNNLSVASVNSTTGLVSALGVGIAFITASNGSVSSTLNLTVLSSAPSQGSGSGGGGGGGGRICTTQWSCTSWSSCIDAEQVRTCSYNSNWCVPTSNRPAQSQYCTSTGSDVDLDDTPIETETGISQITGAITGTGISATKISLLVAAVLAAVLVTTLVVLQMRK